MSNQLFRRDSAKSKTLTSEQLQDLHAAFNSVSTVISIKLLIAREVARDIHARRISSVKWDFSIMMDIKLQHNFLRNHGKGSGMKRTLVVSLTVLYRMSVQRLFFLGIVTVAFLTAGCYFMTHCLMMTVIDLVLLKLECAVVERIMRL